MGQPDCVKRGSGVGSGPGGGATGHLVAASARYRYLARAAGDTAEHEMSTGHAEQVLTSYEGKPALLLVKSSALGGAR